MSASVETQLRFELSCAQARIEDMQARLERQAPQGLPLRDCVYCSERCRGRACAAHADLLELDPGAL